MPKPDHREDLNTTFTFYEAEQIFDAEMPQFLKALQNRETERAKREFIYRFIAAKLTPEGILEADPDVSDVKPIMKTLTDWHGLWADALGALSPVKK